MGQPDGAMYFRSLHAPKLFAGCEQVPLGIVFGLGVGPLWVGINAILSRSYWFGGIVAGLGLAVLLGGLYALRQLAKHDPIFVRAYRRNRKYRTFYPARSTPRAAR